MIKQSESKVSINTAAPIRSIVAILKATLKAYIFLIICFALLAVVYTYSKMPSSYLTPAINIISALSLILAGFDSSRKVRVMGYLHGAGAGFLCSLIRIIIGLLVFGSYVPTDGIGKSLILGTLISAVGGIAGVNFGKNKKRKK